MRTARREGRGSRGASRRAAWRRRGVEEEEPMGVWDPSREFESLRRELDRALGEAGGPAGRARQAFLPGRGARQYPLVNVSDDGERYYVEALAPGADPSKLEVTVVRNTLTIAGEKLAPA